MRAVAAGLAVALLASMIAPATSDVLRPSRGVRSSSGGGHAYAVYRMLGNDMWPLQGSGQMRQNSVFSAMHEEPAPANVPVYWVVNRIVNATERALLVSQLKTAGAKRILYVSPPLSAMHCLSSEQARVLFAQAQNSVRNAMLAHARANGHEWALPLDGNQFLPKTFYATMSSIFRHAEYFKRFAVLIPMLRVRHEQTAETLHADVPLRTIMNNHFTSKGDFLVSEPQLALHTSRLSARGLSFDERSQYGKSNKAELVGKLCSRRDRLSLSTRCCEVVRANMRLGFRLRTRSGYSGGEVNLKSRVADISRRRIARSTIGTNDPSGMFEAAPGGGISTKMTAAILDEAERISRQCGVTLRLFNYPAVDDSASQHTIATDVNVRARFRYKAGKFLRRYIAAYLAHSTKPSSQVGRCRLTVLVS